MGWIGWTERQAMGSDVNSIALAIEGRTKMLSLIFGGDPKPNARPQRMTGERWKAIVRRNNLKYRGHGKASTGE